MKIGIIGAGRVARAHATAATTLKNIDLAGAYDIHHDQAKRMCAEFGGRVFDSIDDLLQEADGVIVASPNFAHAEHVSTVLAAGRAVLCEKPLATSLEQARTLVNLAADTPAAVMGFNYRHLPVVRMLREHLRRGDLGEPCAMEVGFRKESALRRRSHTWRDSGSSRRTSGALGDLGVHLVDLLSFVLAGRIDLGTCRVRAFTAVAEKEDTPVEVDDHAEVYGLHSRGAVVSVVTSKVTEPTECGFSIRLTGSDGVFRYHSRSGSQYTLERIVGQSHHSLATPLLADPSGEFHGWADSFRNQLSAWAARMVGDQGPTSVLAGLDSGREAQEFLEACLCTPVRPPRTDDVQEVAGARG